MHLFHLHSLLKPDLAGWRMAGAGRFRSVDVDTIESSGGSGLFWYEREVYENFILKVQWRVQHREDNSGVFLRCPPLLDDLRPAIERGFEVQIDERGFDPQRKVEDSPLHRTGALYRIAPAKPGHSRPIGEWNEFEIVVQGANIDVMLNGARVCAIDNADREPRGHIALQAHHEGSRVQFRELRVRRLND